MKNALFALLLLVTSETYAHGYLISVTTRHYPSFVCFNGRVLTATSVGLTWEAKRSCFISRQPCSNFQADYYGSYFNTQQLRFAYARCRSAHPFRWGDGG